MISAKPKKESKRPLTVLVKPSIKKRAAKKAAKNNISLSQLVEDLLFDYSAE